MLHAMRQSIHRTGRLLLPLLLLSWLSLVCGHCVALAGAVDTAPVGHHESADVGHDCCPEVEADPCLGGDCEHTADMQQAPVNGKIGDQQHTPAILVSALFPLPATRGSALPVHPPNASPGPHYPLYLRNCVFLI